MRFLLLLTLCALAAPALSAQSLFADPKANRAGDILTIVLSERTNAARSSQYDDQSRATLGGSAAGNAGATFALDATFAQDAEASNRTVQSDLLSGTLTALVDSVTTQGNLFIVGEKSLNVNGVTHVMKVRGLVRPLDVRYDNTILSYQIADAHIEYRKAGRAAKLLPTGRATRLAALGLLGAALFLVAN
jgi:flagellar L-ring protein precursor FlgH